MHRFGHHSGKLVLRCRRCGQVISQHLLAAYLERRLLEERGHLSMHRRTLAVPHDAAATKKLASIDSDLRTTALALTVDGADVLTIAQKLARLKQARATARRAARTTPVDTLTPLGSNLREVWRHYTTDEQRNDILRGQIQSLTITRGRHGGRGLDHARVALSWSTDRRPVVPDGVSLDAVHAHTPKPEPWISQADAALLTGLRLDTIRTAVEAGHIERRHVHRALPSLSRASVQRYAQHRNP